MVFSSTRISTYTQHALHERVGLQSLIVSSTICSLSIKCYNYYDILKFFDETFINNQIPPLPLLAKNTLRNSNVSITYTCFRTLYESPD